MSTGPTDLSPALNFQKLFEAVPGLYLVLTRELKIAAVSDSYLRATMTKRNEILGKGVFEVFADNPNDPAANGVRNINASLQRVIATRAPDTMAVQKFDIRRPDSQGGEFEERFWSPVNSPVLDANGEVAFIINRVEDVTEFVQLKQRGDEQDKHAEVMRIRGEQMETEIFSRAQELQKANHKLLQANDELSQIKEELERRVDERTKAAQRRQRLYDAALSNIPDFVYVFDLNHRFTYANEILLEMWGKTWEEAIGKNCLELGYEPWHAAMHDQEIDQVVASRQPIKGEVPFTGTFGRRIYEYIFSPVLGVNGEVEAVAGTTRDITDRIQSEEQIRQGEQRTRIILESITDAFFSLDINWRFTYVNPQAEKLLDRKPGDLIGKTIWDEYELKGSEFEKAYRKVASERTTQSFTSYYPQHDRWYEVHVYPAIDGISIYFRDDSDRKRAEQALRESEERRRLALDAAELGAWNLDPSNMDLITDKRFRAIFGTSSERLGYQEAVALIHPGDQTRVQDAVDAAMRAENPLPYNVEYRVIHPGGAIVWVHAKGRAHFESENAERKLTSFNGTVADVTERKSSEEKLRESELKFRALADTMPQLVWSTGANGTIDYLNRKFYEFSGLPDGTQNEAWATIVHPNDLPSSRERWAVSVKTGEPYEMEMRLLEQRSQTYRWHLIRTVPMRYGAGHISRWFGTGTDIHEQKRALDSSRYLAEASAALASVVDYESTLQKVVNLAVPYFADWSAVDVTDNQGSLRRLAVAHQNREKIKLAHDLMNKYPPDPESPTGSTAVLRSGKPLIVGEITDDMLLKGARNEDHLRLIRSLGLKSYVCVPLMVSGNPFGILTFATAESGRIYTDADLALANDLAHRAGVAIENTQLYQALKENDRRKDEFLATLAHELRNPLAPIRNSLQILKMPRIDAATIERTRAMMERQLHHLVRLVDDLLDVSRVMRGKIELRKEEVELASVVARAIETVQPLIEGQSQQLTVDLPDESLLLNADPMRLAQVVGNLLTNAAKYTDSNGHIWLTAERAGDNALLKIRDDGIGLAPEMLTRVFELFVQVDHAATRSQGGLGIGLTLVKNLCEMHNGSVEARSEGLGKGSEFIVRLPISQSASGEGQSSEKANFNAAIPPSGFRLLVVDDNKDAAESLNLLLQLQGHEVRVAFSATEALEISKRFTPDVAFLDIGMPGMDGYELARRFHEQPGFEKVQLVALTGWGQQEDRRRTAKAGFNYHMVKPLDPDALEKLMRELKV